MTIDESVDFLGYRIDRIQQPMLNLNVPFFNGISAVDGKLEVRANRICSMYLSDKDLKKVDRIWQVGLFDDTSARGISVFEGNTLLEALNKAVEYVKGQIDY